MHQLDREKGITLEDFKLIKMHMANCMYIKLSLLKIYVYLYECFYTYNPDVLYMGTCSLTIWFEQFRLVCANL